MCRRWQKASLGLSPALRSCCLPVPGITSSIQNACLYQRPDRERASALTSAFPGNDAAGFQKVFSEVTRTESHGQRAGARRPPLFSIDVGMNALESQAVSTSIGSTHTGQRDTSFVSFLEVQPNCLPWTL